MNKVLPLIALGALLFCAPAQAQCTSPDGVKGSLNYDHGSDDRWESCDGSDWVEFQASGGGGGGGQSDSVPDNFSFTDEVGILTKTTVTSNAVTIAGINSVASVSVTGGNNTEYNINETIWVSAGTGGVINNGETIQVRSEAENAFLTPSDITITIGGVSDTWTITTSDNLSSESHTSTQCDAAGGTPTELAGDWICSIPGATCPSGWTQYITYYNWSSKSCGSTDWHGCGSKCTTGSGWSTSTPTCGYVQEHYSTYSERCTGAVNWTCTASKNAIACI